MVNCRHKRFGLTYTPVHPGMSELIIKIDYDGLKICMACYFHKKIVGKD